MNLAEIILAARAMSDERLLEFCRHSRPGVTSSPVSLELHPTHLCNLDCRYCYTAQNRSARLPTCASMPTDGEHAFMAWLKQSHALQSHALQSIVLTGGGEPLLAPKALLEGVIDHCARTDTLLGIVTHALDLPAALSSRLGEVSLFFNVSLKAVNAPSFEFITGRDRFEQQQQSLRFLLKKRMRSHRMLVTTRLVFDGALAAITPLSELVQLLDFLLSEGLDMALISFSNPAVEPDSGRIKGSYFRLLAGLEEHPMTAALLAEGRLRFSNRHYAEESVKLYETSVLTGTCYLSGLLMVLEPSGRRRCFGTPYELDPGFWIPGQVVAMSTERCRNCRYIAFNKRIQARLEDPDPMLGPMFLPDHKVVEKLPFILH